MATRNESSPSLQVLTSPDWQDYDLLDSGDGQKLERYGPYRLLRPEPEAVWHRSLPAREWSKVHAVFKPAPEENGGHWQPMEKLPERWIMQYRQLRFYVQTTASRHLGVFPEQAAQWDWISRQVDLARRPVKVLNLFGYTGLATLAAAQSGAVVTHLDASRKVVQWANENLTLSNLQDRSVRWIVDDALKFVLREARRDSTYDGIILDPPKFGRGPKGEVWEFYKLLPNLLEACRQILTPQPLFIVLTAYAVKASPLTLYYAMQEMMQGKAGTLGAGEICLIEKSAGRFLSTAIFSRWTSVE